MKKLSFFIMLLAITFGMAQPTTNAPTPTALAANVVSVFSDAYTNIATDYRPNWGQSTAVNATYVPVTGSGNNVLAYTVFTYEGTNLTTTNCSSMEYLHVDIWTSSATVVKVSPINNGTGAGEFLVNVPLVNGGWSSVDLPKSAFTGMTWDSVFQLKFDGQAGVSPSTIYLDNIYFWKTPVSTTTDATLSDLKVAGTTITAFGPTTLTYTYNLVVGTTTVPQITAATPTQAASTKIITQATSIPGSATVVVTAPDGVTQKTYTVNFVASIPPPSPTHSTTGTILPLNYNTSATVNDTGTPASATAWNPQYNFGSYTSINNLASTGTNNAIFMNLTSGYGAGGADTDVSSYSYLNFDYFISSSEVPGVNGDQFYFDLISDSPVKENLYYVKPAVDNGDAVMVKGSWKTLSIPLSAFIAKGFNPAKFFQFKLGSDSNINTSAVYFDNIYFSSTPATLGVIDNQKNANKLSIYPNPVAAGENINISAKVKNVEIYGANGQLVKASHSQTVSSQGLSKGLYLVKITDENGKVQASKLIVK